MIRSFFIFIFFICFLNAQTINFKEEKYIDAIDKTVYNKGTLKLLENETRLKYKNSSKILINKDDELYIQDNKDIQVIDSSKQLTLKILFLLIKSIINDDFQTLKEFFYVSLEDKVYVLNPKEQLKDYINLIKFKKDTKLEFLTIYMKNGNKTTIRETNG